jgi:hypothetical protein
VQAPQLSPSSQKLEGHDSAGECNQRSQEDALVERHSQDRDQRGPEGHGGQDLRDSAEQPDPAESAQLREREFGTDGEHEEGNPDLSQHRDRLPIQDEAWRERADHHARDQVADYHRQPDSLGKRTPDEGCQQGKNKIEEEVKLSRGAHRSRRRISRLSFLWPQDVSFLNIRPPSISASCCPRQGMARFPEMVEAGTVKTWSTCPNCG